MHVERLTSREIPRASRLLAHAFDDDPFIGHFFTGARRRLAFPPFFRSALRGPVSLGTVYGAKIDGRLVGIAAWAAPGAAHDTPRRAKVDRALVQALYPRAATHLSAAFETIGALHPAEAHWYLAFVGIDPELQGRGIGRALLEPVLARADEEGVLCYLETPFPATHRFYRRLGFDLTDELHPDRDAPPVWAMTRRPRQNAPA